LDDLVAEVAGGEMREGEHADTGLARYERRLSRRGVQRLAGTLALLCEKRRLVHEKIRPRGGLHHGRRRSGVAREDELAPLARGPEDLPRVDVAAIREHERFPALQEAALGTVRHSQGVGSLDVESPWPLVLDEGVAHRRDAVVDLEGLEPVAASLETVPHSELDGLERVRQPPEDPPERGEERAQASRAGNREG